jgi:hypothetical protein
MEALAGTKSRWSMTPVVQDPDPCRPKLLLQQ